MKFFQDLPLVVFVGNPDLCINNECRASKSLEGNKSIRNIIIYTLLGVILTSAVVTCGVILALRIQGDNSYGRNNFDEVEMEWPFILFQKFNFNINDIVSKFSDSNIVIKGCSDVVYRVETLTLLQGNRCMVFCYVCKVWKNHRNYEIGTCAGEKLMELGSTKLMKD